MNVLNELLLWLGVPRSSASHSEKWISAIGAALGLLVVSLSSLALHHYGVLDQPASFMVVASMGASAVLLFAVPHGALSQPWAVLGGHIISALVGVSCLRLFGPTLLASALAVGLAVAAMSYSRCIHPPGGATALTAVIGGESIQQLGYLYIATPVLLNLSLMLLVALVFNACFHWRRYPAHSHFKRSAIVTTLTQSSGLTQEDLSAAIQQHDSFVDITEEGLTELLELAKIHAEKSVSHPHEIDTGKCYSNGQIGHLWSIRQVLDASEADVSPAKNQVIYKVLAGHQVYQTGLCLREDFKQWARFEVIQKESRWVKVTNGD